MQLKCLDGWVSTWALPQMFAGVAQQGAADATYQVLPEVEKMTLEGVPYCGGAAEIYKFFDQILRSLVYMILRLAGMPTCILEAYKRFLEELVTYNILAGGLGHRQKRVCGLPQGRPLSLMVVALLMRAWLVMMLQMRVDPRVLADDVLLIAKGGRMMKKFAAALEATHRYLQAMAARIAPDKSYNFASVKEGKKWLRETWWSHIQGHIEVVDGFRYLGVHLSTQLTRKYTTLVERWQKAMLRLRKLSIVAASASAKAKTIRTNIFPGLFYGIEANDLTEKQLAAVAAAVMDVLAGKNDNHDVDRFFVSRSEGKDLDPASQLLLRRGLELRRCICKRPHARQSLKETLLLYLHQAKGAGLPTHWYREGELMEENQEYPEPLSHPTKFKSGKWKLVLGAKGPVGLLIQAAMRCGAQIDEEFRLWQRKEVPLDLLNVPYQHLSQSLLEAVARARTKAAKGTKTINAILSEIDAYVTNASLKVLDEEQKALVNVLKSGGGYGKVDLAKLDSDVSGTCDYCGHLDGDVEHLLWSCTFFPTGPHETRPGDSNIAAAITLHGCEKGDCACNAM